MTLPRIRPGLVFVISSPSGGGKTSVVQRLLRRTPRLMRSVSVTTRAPRDGEHHRLDYQFVSRDAFARLRRTAALLEWAKVHGAYYGTPRAPIAEAIIHGRDVLLSIDVQGARQIRRALGAQAVLIFLLPPALDGLRERLVRRRTETAATIRTRLAAAKRETACAAWYDHRVPNDTLTKTVTRVGRIIARYRARARRQRRG